MNVIKIAQVPAPSVPISATIKEAVPLMVSDAGCGIAVTSEGRLAGTLSRDEVMLRVIAEGLNPETTTVKEIMSAPAEGVAPDTDANEAIKFMFERRQCHLPIVDSEGVLKGWLGICNLFRNHVEDLNHELDSLQAYFTADGPGG